MDMLSFMLGKALGGGGGGSSVEVEALTATENKTYTAPEGKAYSPVTVNVPIPVGGLEYETGTWTPDTDTNRGTISFANQHTKAPVAFVVMDISDPSTLTGYAILCMRYFDCYRAFGDGFNAGKSGGKKYSTITVIEASANGSSFQTFNSNTSTNSDSTFASTSSYPKWWCTNTELHVCDADQGGNCKAGRSYKWIAIWMPETA